mgnify:CR=1 FL=1
MIYLNDDFTGGETAFNEVIIHPKMGTALCFIHEQKHQILNGMMLGMHLLIMLLVIIRII